MASSNGSETISRLLKKVAQIHGLERRLACGKVWEVWQEAVGEAIARHAWPKGIREGTKLVVAVVDSVWMQQLSLQKTLLLEVLNRHLPEKAHLEDIRFVYGDVKRLRQGWIKGMQKGLKQKARPLKVDPELQEKAELMVAPIKDNELREALMRLFLKSQSG